jgi:signal transduction histidine kinase
MKHISTLILISSALIGAIAIDYLATWPYIMTPLYAIPVLVAAYRLPLRGVAAIAALVTGINLVSGMLEGTPLEVVLLYTSGLLITSYLATALAWQRQETAQHARAAEQHAQAAEMAHQRLQEFLGMVAHDLRSPLAAIFGSLQILTRRAIQAPSAREQRPLQLIETATQSISRLLDDLRDASAAGAGHFAVHTAQSDLVAIARRVVELQQAPAADHQVVLDAPAHLEGMWDGQRLDQLLTNLVSNAIKYSPAGSEVQVSVRGGAGEACVRVSDHGIGLSPDQIQRLFQPFTRLYNGQEVQGAGLGLYISKAIVEAHGGRIWVESAPGQGSTFMVTLPTPAWSAGVRPRWKASPRAPSPPSKSWPTT